MLAQQLMENLGLLPQKVKVKILKGKSGSYIAELPELDAHTEADSLEELDFMINDLIFAIYDVPESIQKLVRYIPEEKKMEFDPKKWLIFQQFISSDAKHILR